MKIKVIAAGRLTPDHLSAWERLQAGNSALDSPFFRCEFTQAVAAVRDDADVAVLEEDGHPVGFLPFHRKRFHVGVPVGSPLSDFQGVIADRDFVWDPKRLLHGCRLKGWQFNHLLACQEAFRPYHSVQADSPYIDLSRGFEAYLQEREAAGCEQFRNTRRKARKARREIGPVRFERHTDDRRVFRALLAWKTAQYRRKKATNYLAPAWTVALLESLLKQRNEAFSGVLSALYLGDRLAAVHLGMRSFGVLHFWFPAYDPELGKYSPGLILLVEMAQAASALGIRRIDLGRGNERYKTSLMSAATRLAEGSVDLRPMAALLRRGWLRVRESVRGSVLRRPVRYVVGSIRQRLGSYAPPPSSLRMVGGTGGGHEGPWEARSVPQQGQQSGISTR
jgi:CelD/BcsL family acetyltransferase involved in cellulose biosynthesis